MELLNLRLVSFYGRTFMGVPFSQQHNGNLPFLSCPNPTGGFDMLQLWQSDNRSFWYGGKSEGRVHAISH